MNIFWFIAAIYAPWLAFIMFTGRIRIRGRLLADRDTEPKLFRFYLAGFTVGLLIVIAQAIFPPYSN